MTAVLRVEEASARYLVEIEPTLMRGFELLVTAPSGIARLRDLICSLAVTGRLLPHEPFDQPAANLIAPLRRERTRLAEAGRIRKDRDADAGEAIQLDFELPFGWEAVRLADVAWPQAGFAFKSSAFNGAGHGLPLIRIRDVGANSPTMYFSGEFREEFIVRPGDWLIGMDGDFRVAQWNGPDALLNQRVTRLIFFGDEIEQLYVTLALQIELRKLQGTKAYTTVDHLSGSQIASRVIALPPLAEQRRIVARVEELMKLCDALEQNGRLADEQHARLTSTLFDALAASESAHALAENWQRVAEHFDLLLDRPEAIDALDQVILQLAVRGWTVAQDARDEPASVLRDRICTEKERLGREGRQPRTRSSRDRADNRPPFELPESWEWVTLDEIATQITDGAHHTPSYVAEGVPFLSVKNLSSGRMDFSDTRFITLAAHAELSKRCRPELGDVLLTKIGTTGIAVVIDDPRPFSIFVSVALIKLPSGLIDRQFLSLVINSPFVRKQSEDGTEGVGNKNLVLRKIAAFAVPLPPLAEQRRIVARVEELRRLCVQLREQLTEARRTQSQLADALVAEVAA